MRDDKQDMKRQEHYARLANSVVNTNRWSELEKKMLSTESNIFLNSRQQNVFFELLCALRTEYDSLKYDYSENKYTSRSLLAWRARNILEINTWLRFCCEKTENAEEFFKWAGEDQLELEDQLEKWGQDTDQPSEWFEEIERIRKYVLDQSEKRGIPDLKSNYRSPSKVAKEFGHDKNFKIHNKILSKFAHPTPMYILTKEQGDGLPKRAFYFYSQACLFFYDAILGLEMFLEENKKEAA